MKYQIYTIAGLQKGKAKIQPGDFILTHSNNFFSWLIRISTASKWNHAALITNTNGNLIEIITTGIRKNKLQNFPKNTFHSLS